MEFRRVLFRSNFARCRASAHIYVAHLVTAATIICADARQRAKFKSFGDFGFDAERLGPFTIAMMMPDFVVSLGLSFQEYGLNSIAQSREQPMLDPENLWRIAPEMNVVAVPPPFRKISDEAIAILERGVPAIAAKPSVPRPLRSPRGPESQHRRQAPRRLNTACRTAPSSTPWS